jgi:hypothetical protein
MSHTIYYSKVNKQLEFSWLSEVKVSSWTPMCVSVTQIFFSVYLIILIEFWPNFNHGIVTFEAEL